MIVLLAVAFLAGIVTVLSPCILPVLPIVLGSSMSGDRRRPFAVIAGLIVSFAFFTLASVSIITALHLPSDLLRLFAIAIVAFFGLSLIVPAVGERVERALARLPAIGEPIARSNRLGGFVMGLGLGLVWAPCAGPILGAITSLAVTQPGSPAAVALVLAYALGFGLPMLALAIGGRWLAGPRRRIGGSSGRIQRTFGVLILAVAALMAFNLDVQFTTWAVGALPDWTGTLQSPERAALVQQELTQIEGIGPTVPGPSAPAASDPAGRPSGLPVGPAAPEFAGIDHWINSAPLSLAGLRGKVVLVDFWTYSCINCIRTLPIVEAWSQKYAAQGLVVVGVHTPEFAFEHDTGNVEAAVMRFGITYPVAQDNEYGTWQAWGNQYWPADYLIDAQGRVRDAHFGEGDYAITEANIQSLLTEAGATVASNPAPDPPSAFGSGQTPETYLGVARQSGFASPEAVADGPSSYTIPSTLRRDEWAVSGAWTFGDEFATAAAAGDTLRLRFTARDVYLVMSSPAPGSVRVTVSDPAAPATNEDADASGRIAVAGPRLYHLAHLDAPGTHTIDITFDAAGIQAYAFTFGS